MLVFMMNMLDVVAILSERLEEEKRSRVPGIYNDKS
jgi:hypothetical protein